MTSSVCGGGVGQYRANVIGRLGKGVAMNKLRTLADVLRQAGFARITGLFLVFYLLCSTAVWRALWTILSIWKSSIVTSLPTYRAVCANIADANARTGAARHDEGD